VGAEAAAVVRDLEVVDQAAAWADPVAEAAPVGAAAQVRAEAFGKQERLRAEAAVPVGARAQEVAALDLAGAVRVKVAEAAEPREAEQVPVEPEELARGLAPGVEAVLAAEVEREVAPVVAPVVALRNLESG